VGGRGRRGGAALFVVLWGIVSGGRRGRRLEAGAEPWAVALEIGLARVVRWTARRRGDEALPRSWLRLADSAGAQCARMCTAARLVFVS